jgi:hypothetical protein
VHLPFPSLGGLLSTLTFYLELLCSASKSNNRQCFCNVHVLLTLTLLFLELFSFGLELPRSAVSSNSSRSASNSLVRPVLQCSRFAHTHTIRYYQFGVTVFGNRVIHALHTILTSRPGVLRAAQLLVLSSTRRCHGDNQGLT